MSKKVAMRINPFKLHYYRKKANMTLENLAEETGLPLSKLELLENGKVKPGDSPKRFSQFAEIDWPSLCVLSDVLNCKELLAGKVDDFKSDLIQFYLNHKSSDEFVEKILEEAIANSHSSIKAIVFDFDGTLTKPGFNRTTWELLWTKIGYTVNDCGRLAQRFFRKEISHEEWCRLTLIKFKEKKLTRDMVISIGKKIKLVKGFKETIETIYQNNIPMFITSGSILDVISAALCKYYQYFERIEANAFSYMPDGLIANITGTHYDFGGKAQFVKMIAKDLDISNSEVLFVGNSINDEWVKEYSGAQTLLINPHHTIPNMKWDYYIPHLETLTEILPFVGIKVEKTKPTKIRKQKENEALSLLVKESFISLDDYTVVGGYRRFNGTIRTNLIALCDRIKESLLKKGQGRQNYLISAAPGSGKTYLIEELAKSIKDEIQFINIDLSRDPKELVEKKLSQILNVQKNCLVMIDEIDGRDEEEWPYDTIYKKLDFNELPSMQNVVVFTLIGSSGGTSEGLRNVIASRYKGKDLIDRISEAPEFKAEIPRLEFGDGLCVYCSKILELSKSLEKRIVYVEKLAAYYSILTSIHSPRQIKMLAENAIGRVNKTSSILTYDHHFEAGNQKNKEFWANNYEAARKLGSETLKILG